MVGFYPWHIVRGPGGIWSGGSCYTRRAVNREPSGAGGGAGQLVTHGSDLGDLRLTVRLISQERPKARYSPIAPGSFRFVVMNVIINISLGLEGP